MTLVTSVGRPGNQQKVVVGRRNPSLCLVYRKVVCSLYHAGRAVYHCNRYHADHVIYPADHVIYPVDHVTCCGYHRCSVNHPWSGDQSVYCCFPSRRLCLASNPDPAPVDLDPDLRVAAGGRRWVCGERLWRPAMLRSAYDDLLTAGQCRCRSLCGRREIL